jgi:hypothetical protein
MGKNCPDQATILVYIVKLNEVKNANAGNEYNRK